jgi:hypothetical protein
MNITSLSQLKWIVASKRFNFFAPTISYLSRGDEFYTYNVQRGEEMRIDLVVLSMYQEDPDALAHVDVILYLNNIDNPLNIVEGMSLIYPPSIAALDSYRVILSDNTKTGRAVRKALAVPNKSSKKDSARKKFTENDYLLPPVVLNASKEPVRLEEGKIVIGGIK